MRVAEPAGHRERVARPQTPDKTAHRLQHTHIEHAWVEPQIACELRRVMKTNQHSTLTAEYAISVSNFHMGNSGPTSVLIGLLAQLWYGIAAAAVVAAIASTAALPLLPPPCHRRCQ